MFKVLKKIKYKALWLNFKTKFVKYASSNKQLISFIILTLICTVSLRANTIGNLWDIRALMFDLTVVLMIGALGYLFKVKNQFAFFFTCLLVISIMCVINTVYYVFYASFASFGLLESLFQVGDVGDSVLEKLEFYQFTYLFYPLIFYYIHRVLNKKLYFNLIAKVEKRKIMFCRTMLAAMILLMMSVSTLEASDISRLTKLWYRESVVERYGIVIYQFNDLINTLTPKFNALFGYDKAIKNFTDFYTLNQPDTTTNNYTNKYKDKNIIFVHLESIQSYLLGMSFNGVEVTPSLNKLVKESTYFEHFYPQISVGTSSDTEFTLLTSLMPAQSGTVFISYYDRKYIAMPELLKEQGYYTFSMHGNKAEMWNRKIMHPNLGYTDFFSKKDFEIDEVIGLGLSDKSFFRQVISKLETIEANNDKYMGTIITLSNHSPFEELDSYGEFDLTNTYEKINEETGRKETVIDEYLEGTKIGNYLKSVHYADAALGEFITMINSSKAFDDTVFIFYGDHESRVSKKSFKLLFNYDKTTGEYITEEDERYVQYDYYAEELNKNTPLIIWEKGGTKKKTISYPMGMYDILPTIGNMVGISSPYALGHDIFNTKNDNIVIFPNGNFMTSKVYYNNAKEQYIALNNEPIDENYINELKKYTEERLNVSNNIITYDLIRNELTKKEISNE